MATISLRIDDDDLMLIKNYAQLNNLNMSDFIRQTISKGLVSNRGGQWHYRIGDYRLIANIEDEKLIIMIIAVGHRKEVYKSN